MDDAWADRFRLAEHEQLALAAASLWLMNQDLDQFSDSECEDIRDSFREELRGGPLGRGTPEGEPLAIEEWEVLEDLLHTCDDTPRNLSVLVELITSEPFADRGLVMDEDVKRAAIESISIALGGLTDEDDVERIHGYLRDGRKAAKSKALLWIAIGAGGLAGVLTAGTAAPAIGAAIGGAMGLQGAAATAAGLAWLGGGALAAGGLGMAGGSMVIAVAGAATGAGIASLVANGLPGKRIEGEALKAYALGRSLQDYGRRNEPPPEDAGFGELAVVIQRGLEGMAKELEELFSEYYDRRDYERATELHGAAAVTRRLAKHLKENAA